MGVAFPRIVVTSRPLSLSSSSSSSFSSLRYLLPPAAPLYFLHHVPSSSIRRTAYVISNASFNVAIPGLRPSAQPRRTAASRGESRGYATLLVQGVGGAGAAVHQGCTRN